MGRTQATGTMVKNQLCGAVRISDDFAVPEANDGPSALLEKSHPPPVVTGSHFRMLPSVELDGHSCFAASQVNNVWTDHQLAGEARPILAQSQPQQSLRLGRRVAQVARMAGELWIDAAHRADVAKLACARTHPLPLPGREGR